MPRRAKLDPRTTPVMPAKCASCPFGPSGDPQVRKTVEARALTHSQICHHPRTKGKKETHLCRGSRDLQLRLCASLGIIDEPTDEAWAKKLAELNKPIQ